MSKPLTDALLTASPALVGQDEDEPGTCSQHPDGERWSFYDRHIADMTWHCWPCLEEHVAALRERNEALVVGLRLQLRRHGSETDPCGCAICNWIRALLEKE